MVLLDFNSFLFHRDVDRNKLRIIMIMNNIIIKYVNNGDNNDDSNVDDYDYSSGSKYDNTDI